MPTPNLWIAEMSAPSLPNGSDIVDRLTAMEAALIGVLLISGLILVITYHWGRRLYRQWVAANLKAFAEENVSSPDAIKEGSHVILEIAGADGTRRQAATIRSKQQKLVGLGLPQDGKGTIVAVGTPMRVTVMADAAALRFQTIVSDRRIINGVPTLFVPEPEWVERIQRRSFFRVGVQLPTAVTWRGSVRESDRIVSGVIDNLSAGGFRIALPVEVAEDTRITIRLPIVALTGASFDARVLRCLATTDDDPLPYRAHCEFLWISEETRSLLVNYCFDVQREWLRTRPHAL